MTRSSASLKSLLTLSGLLCALLCPRPVRAGWNGAEGQDSFGRDDVSSVARTLGDAKVYKKVMRNFDLMAQQTRENDRRMEALQRRYQRDAQLTQERREGSGSGAAMSELGASAGGERVTAQMSAPGVDEGAPVDPDKKKLSDKDQALWAQCRKTAEKITLSPEIKQWVAEFFWNVAKHQGGNEPLKKAVETFNQVRSSEGKFGGYTIKIGPMPDENTYGLYTTGIREIVLRANMPKKLFLGVLEHELDHGVDDMRDEQSDKISYNWHRRHGDNIFGGKDGKGGKDGQAAKDGQGGAKGGCKDCAGQQEPPAASEGADQPKGAPAAKPAEGGEETLPPPGKPEKAVTAKAETGETDGQAKSGEQGKESGDQYDAEYAETYAWRLMGCAGGGENPCNVQKCN